MEYGGWLFMFVVQPLCSKMLHVGYTVEKFGMPCQKLLYAKLFWFLLGAYGYVHKGKAKGTSEDDTVFPIAAKIMKGKECFIFWFYSSHDPLLGRLALIIATILIFIANIATISLTYHIKW